MLIPNASGWAHFLLSYRADHMTQIWPIRVPRSFTPTQWFLDMHMTQTVKGSPRTAAKIVKEEEPYLETMSTEWL